MTIEELVGDVNHSVLNPLSIISMLSEQIEDQEVKSKIQDACQRIDDYCKSLIEKDFENDKENKQ